jgi:hypothetical protein
MAVRQINDEIMMTSSEAHEKYATLYVGFARVESNMSDPDNERGYVVYVADTKKEMHTMPRKTESGVSISIEPGYALGGFIKTASFTLFDFLRALTLVDSSA